GERRDDRPGDEEPPARSDRAGRRETADQRPDQTTAGGAGGQTLRHLRSVLDLEFLADRVGHEQADLRLSESALLQALNRTCRVRLMSKDPRHRLVAVRGHIVVPPPGERAVVIPGKGASSVPLGGGRKIDPVALRRAELPLSPETSS